MLANTILCLLSHKSIRQDGKDEIIMTDESSTYQPLEKGKISVLQFALLAITLVIATADLFLPAFVAQEAMQDAWISVIIATIYSVIIANIFLTLGLKYPHKTIIQYSCDILGKPLGKLTGFAYVYFYLYMSWSVARELGELFIIAFNPYANLAAYITLVIIVAAYAIWQGLEVIARVNQMLAPIGIGLLLFVALVNLPVTDLRNFLPIMHKGIHPSIRGSILIQAWMLEIVIFLQCIPFIKQQHKIRKAANISLIILGFSMLIGVLTIAVFGSLTPKLILPALQYVRVAKLGEYFQHLDIMIAGIWITGIFIKTTIFFYVSVLASSQLFEIRSYKPMIIPIGTLLISFSLYATKRVTDMLHALHYIFPFFSLTMSSIIPSILLIVSILRNRDTTKKKES